MSRLGLLPNRTLQRRLQAALDSLPWLNTSLGVFTPISTPTSTPKYSFPHFAPVRAASDGGDGDDERLLWLLRRPTPSAEFVARYEAATSSCGAMVDGCNASFRAHRTRIRPRGKSGGKSGAPPSALGKPASARPGIHRQSLLDVVFRGKGAGQSSWIRRSRNVRLVATYVLLGSLLVWLLLVACDAMRRAGSGDGRTARKGARATRRSTA
jgi:hypothetical protein